MKATEEDKARLQAIIDDLKKQLAELGVNPIPTLGGDNKKSSVDILGMSVEDWEQLHSNIEAGKFGLDEIVAVAKAIASAFSSVNELVSAMEQREFKNYEKTQKKKKALLDRQLKSGTISQERYNESVQRIDEDTEAKREEMERKQAKRQKELAIFQAITNTAIGITAALTSIPPNPAMAWVVGAIGAIQLATILATPLPGFEEGGLIGVEREQDGKRYRAGYDPHRRGPVTRPTVLVGENGTEYVVPAEGYENPTIRPVLDIMERARRSGTIRVINLPAALAASGVIPGRAVGGYVGGTAPVSEPTVSSAANAATGYDNGVMRELKEVVGKLSRQLEKPLPVAVSAYGRDGLFTVQKKIEQQQLRAGIGSGK